MSRNIILLAKITNLVLSFCHNYVALFQHDGSPPLNHQSTSPLWLLAIEYHSCVLSLYKWTLKKRKYSEWSTFTTKSFSSSLKANFGLCHFWASIKFSFLQLVGFPDSCLGCRWLKKICKVSVLRNEAMPLRRRKRSRNHWGRSLLIDILI